MMGLGMQELVIVGIVAVLLFGRKLPEVAKSLGSSYREFKKGLTDLQSQVDMSDTFSSPNSSTPSYSSSSAEYDDYDETTAPRFEAPPEEPQQVDAASTEPDATSDGSDATSDGSSERDEPYERLTDSTDGASDPGA